MSIGKCFCNKLFDVSPETVAEECQVDRGGELVYEVNGVTRWKTEAGCLALFRLGGGAAAT